MKRFLALLLVAVICLSSCTHEENDVEFKKKKIKNVYIEIPDYWQEDKSETGILRYYAETNSSGLLDYTTVGLEIKFLVDDDDDYEVTFDGLYADNENMIEAIESMYAGSNVLDYEIFESDHGVKGILYKFTFDLVTGLFSSEPSEGCCFCFASETDRRWYYVTMTKLINADRHEYQEDYMTMLASIECDADK